MLINYSTWSVALAADLCPDVTTAPNWQCISGSAYDNIFASFSQPCLFRNAYNSCKAFLGSLPETAY